MDSQDIQTKLAQWEAYFFNQGANWAFLTMFMAFNISMASWGIWQFTAPHWETESDILRVTLPIARAAGRLVTWNVALVLLSGCKYWWTLLRQTPLAFGFPMDNVMPYYHRIIALTIIIMGCVVHTIPQIVNYATETLAIEHDGVVWTFGEDGLPTGQLFYTGVALVLVFGAFLVTTLSRIRNTAWGFRIFWWTHVACISLSIPLLIIHGSLRGSPFTVYFLGVPFIIYLLDIILRRITYSTKDATVLELQAIGGQKDEERVTKVILQCPDFDYSAGQYAELKIPSISSTEWHPFTIASRPTTEGYVAFYIKAVGKWTNALHELATKNTKIQSLETMNLRGPFGAPAQNYFAYKHVIVIGSGIGVTPLLSVWKHLVAIAEYIAPGVIAPSKTPPAQPEAESRIPPSILEEILLTKVNIDNVDVVRIGSIAMETWRGYLAFMASFFESMTINIIVFCLSFAGETLVFCVWVFEKDREAAVLQIILNLVMAGTFGAKMILTLLAYGNRYLVSFVFRLESAILFMDAVSLWSSVEFLKEGRREMAIIYFSFYAAFVLLHGVRIFHIFHVTARPPKEEESNLMVAPGESQIRSITGIWVSRTYDSMSYAVGDLVESVRDLPSSFSLQLYATRDKESVVEEANPFAGCGDKHALNAGRPDWERIMTEAIDRAHWESEDQEGDAVGVFFCGSPAIARVLQRTALQVTASHSYHHGGKCRCRVLLHKENF